MRKYASYITLSIFLLALFLRIYQLPAFIAYHQDQVRDLLFIKNNVDHGMFILLGPKASVGSFFLPPFWYYLMTISYAFSTSPVAPAALVALLSSVTAVLIYLLGKHYLNEKIAIASALIYTVSHISIEHSRFAWNPNPIPFFIILTFFCLYTYIFKHKEWGFYGGIISANLALQLHYQGSIIAIFFLLSLCIYRKMTWQKFIIYFLLNLILIAPFIYYEFTHGFSNTAGIIAFVSKGQSLKLFGIPFYLKFILNEFSLFLSSTLLIANKWIGYILLILFGLSLITVKFTRQEEPIKFFMIFSLFMLFIYKNSLIPFYLLFLIVPTVMYTAICLNHTLPKKIFFPVILSLVIISLLTSPTIGKTDNTYVSMKDIVSTLSQQKNYCIDYDVFDETYIKPKFTYLFLTASNKPSETNCQKQYLICEPAKCNIALSHYKHTDKEPYSSDHTGVYIYTVKR